MAENVVALRGGGSIVGEIAGQVTGYRTATVQATGPVRALTVGAERFEDFLDAHPGAARVHRQITAAERRAAHDYQRNQSLSSGAQRLARLLLDLTERASGPNRDGTEAAPPLSQEDLASLIGASRSTVTRALHDWRARQIIGTDQRHIEILDRARLLAIAGRLARETLSARRALFVSGMLQKSRPLGRRECDHRATVARVSDQHRGSLARDLHAPLTIIARTTLAPG
jgi:CRP/FNR family transcriptional regulator, cyclic AMP receptor protein